MNKRKIIIIGIVAIFLVLIAAFALWPPIKQEDMPLRAGYSLWQGHLPLWVAYEKGFFKEEDLTVELIDLGTNYTGMIDGILNESIDIATGGFPQTMNVQAKHPSLLYAFHMSGETQKGGLNSAIIVLKDSNINAIKDLSGKVIGTDTIVQTLNLKAILNTQGVKDYEIKEVDKKIQLVALTSKSVDALFTGYADVIVSSQKLDTKFLEVNVRAKYFGAPFWKSSSIALAKYIKNNPKKVKAFMRAIDKAIDLIRTDKDRELVVPILVKYMPTLIAETAQDVGLDAFAKSTETIDLNQLEFTVKILRDARVLENEININEFYFSYGKT